MFCKETFYLKLFVFYLFYYLASSSRDKAARRPHQLALTISSQTKWASETKTIFYGACKCSSAYFGFNTITGSFFFLFFFLTHLVPGSILGQGASP